MRGGPAAARAWGLLAALSFPLPAAAQLSERAAWAVGLAEEYEVLTDLTYRHASATALTLDVYKPRRLERPNPVVVVFHGGGWIAGNKNALVLHLLPYLELGFSVVNVEYRLGATAPAPAAVEDCRCALRWVVKNAEAHRFDTGRIVLTGASAGGHLALTTGLLPVSAGFDRGCRGQEPEWWTGAPIPELKAAAIVNWYGITDVADLLEGPHARGYAVEWLGSRPDRQDLARRLSPLAYVRPGAPPVLSVHGEADAVVPYDHAVRLHRALEAASVPNELLTVAGGGHGGFERRELERLYAAIQAFLRRHALK